MTWGTELADICTKIHASNGRGSLSFGDMGISKNQLQELLEFISSVAPGLFRTGTGEFKFYNNNKIFIDYDAKAKNAWLRFFNWRDEGWCVELHIDKGNFMEEYILSHYGDERSPVLVSNYYIHNFDQTGYEGHCGKVEVLTPEQALEYIRLIRSMTGVDVG